MNEIQLSCPVCGTSLIGLERLGFIVYVCDEHGTWLFNGVLEEMLCRFSRANSAMLSKAREELKDLKRAKRFGGTDL